MADMLESDEIARLLTIVEEAARSTEEGIKHFVEPAPGTLGRAVNRRHHIVFGRRGSGKSSLLRKAAADLTVDRRPIAYVNLEAFKGHSYPDVLLSVLISTFQEFKKWMDTAAIHPANRSTFWKKLFGTAPSRSPYNRQAAADLSNSLEHHIRELMQELHQADDAELSLKTERNSSSARLVGGTAQASVPGTPITVGANAQNSSSETSSRAIDEQFRRSKTDFLHRHIVNYQRLFRSLANLSEGDGYLFLDDLYHIRRTDQAKVVDYFHRIAKDHGLWLKVGTIRHRTRWYVHGDPPIGMKVGDDADEIDLDLTLEKYAIAKNFLIRILTNFAQTVKLTAITSFLTDGAIDRLVLASGGVARDFLSIFRRSVAVAQERGGGHRGEKVGAEDVNKAAGEYDSSKREEFKRDTLDEDSVSLESEFQKLRQFCLDENNTNCFLLNKEAVGQEVDLIHELVDLKLVHLVRSRVTVSKFPGKIFEAFMLDVSQYAGARTRRKLDMIEFWTPTSTEALRKSSLIYQPST
jgi:hypothetical protein